MNKLRYYVLTSRDIETLKRCISTLPPKRTVVVINTLDVGFARIAKDMVLELGLEYHITKSDGTPGTGKNSMLDVFLQSDDDYAVMIDGDDYLTPYGVYTYDWIASREKVPDLVVTHNEVYSDDGFKSIEHFKHNRDFRDYKGDYALTTAEHQDSVPLDESIQSVIDDKLDEWGMIKCMHWGTQWHNYREFMNEWSDDSIKPNRMVFWSRKSAELAHYSNELYIGEDTIQYLILKQRYGRGEIDICFHDEHPYPTYIYVSDNIREPGICYLSHPTDIDWVENIFNALDKQEPLEFDCRLQPIDIYEYK
jgi:hypothetical protein